jgi:hypothetical protein
MSSCCDRTVGALLGCPEAGADPMRDILYRRRLDRLRRQLRRFRLDHARHGKSLFTLTHLSMKTLTGRKMS